MAAQIPYIRLEKVLSLPFLHTIARAERDNVIDLYITGEKSDLLSDNVWQQYFKNKPEELSKEEKDDYLSKISGISLASDAFFPFGDNIERAAKSGVSYIAQPGGSIRDDDVINTCNNYNIAMAFTKMRLFHH